MVIVMRNSAMNFSDSRIQGLIKSTHHTWKQTGQPAEQVTKESVKIIWKYLWFVNWGFHSEQWS